MSSVRHDVTVTMEFADETNKTYTLENVDESIRPDVANRVKAINNGTAENVADFRQTFVSNGGESFVSISSAHVITTTEEVIYNG